MLKVTEILNQKNKVELRLEGRIVGSCVSYLENICNTYSRGGGAEVFLDFTDVRYIENQGVKMLKGLTNHNIRIINCPIFIDELLSRNY